MLKCLPETKMSFFSAGTDGNPSALAAVLDGDGPLPAEHTPPFPVGSLQPSRPREEQPLLTEACGCSMTLLRIYSFVGEAPQYPPVLSGTKYLLPSCVQQLKSQHGMFAARQGSRLENHKNFL